MVFAWLCLCQHTFRSAGYICVCVSVWLCLVGSCANTVWVIQDPPDVACAWMVPGRAKLVSVKLVHWARETISVCVWPCSVQNRASANRSPSLCFSFCPFMCVTTHRSVLQFNLCVNNCSSRLSDFVARNNIKLLQCVGPTLTPT